MAPNIKVHYIRLSTQKLKYINNNLELMGQRRLNNIVITF